MVMITWACLNVGTHVNLRYQYILPTQDKIVELFGLMGITFCPGLLEALNAAAPPTISWFQSLPDTIPLHVWGIYVLILKKRGHRSLIYIGSGTGFYRGVRARVKEHRDHKVCPRYVEQACAQGYEITDIRLLAHCPIPKAADVAIIRTVIVALEAAFSCVFWAMYHSNRLYGFGNICPWSRDQFEYGGLCSHNALSEGIRSGEDFDFSEQELENMAAEIKEKNRLYQIQYQRDLRANPTESYKARIKVHNEKQKPGTQVRQKAAVENQLYRCDVCDVSCRDHASLVRHNASPRHQRRSLRGDGAYECAPCGFSNKYLSNYNVHLKTKTHIRNARVRKSSIGLMQSTSEVKTATSSVETSDPGVKTGSSVFKAGTLDQWLGSGLRST